jgi:hypothetical protein
VPTEASAIVEAIRNPGSGLTSSVDGLVRELLDATRKRVDAYLADALQPKAINHPIWHTVADTPLDARSEALALLKRWALLVPRALRSFLAAMGDTPP